MHRKLLAVIALLTMSCTSAPHPRLYFTPSELRELRSQRKDGSHATIYRNLIKSADWCLNRPLRREWIAPVAPDPNFENLYDRFYAIMHDMAVTEHLAFAWAYSRDSRYLHPAKTWMLSTARIWRHEADGEPDASKAYAVLRMLKGVATAYDILYPKLTDDERREIREMITDVGGKYYRWYLADNSRGTVKQGPHHASVEAASFGIAALAVLDEVPEARQWLALMVKKHRESLLPDAIAEDGAQVEGATFWASTVQYRLAFMDALERVTGEDLFTPFADHMKPDLALASIAAEKFDRHDEDHQTVILEPSYGQLNYYSPVLLGLARHYKHPLCQHLAMWDHTAGSLQQTRYITKNNEWLLFAWGGNAYAWYDRRIAPAMPPDAPLLFTFPSVKKTYVRESYQAGGIVAGMRDRAVTIHAGGRPVFVDLPTTAPTTIEKTTGGVTLTREAASEQQWWCYGPFTREGGTLRWEDGTTLRVTTGSIISITPDGYHDEKVVGMGKLKLIDPMPMSYPLITVRPANGKLVVVVATPASRFFRRRTAATPASPLHEVHHAIGRTRPSP